MLLVFLDVSLELLAKTSSSSSSQARGGIMLPGRLVVGRGHVTGSGQRSARVSQAEHLTTAGEMPELSFSLAAQSGDCSVGGSLPATLLDAWCERVNEK